MIGIVDEKYATILRNDKGNLSKLYSLNLGVADIKDINKNAQFYFQREYLLILNRNKIHKVSTRSGASDSITLDDTLQAGQAVFIDTQNFYFLTRGDDDNQTKLVIMGTDMIEAAFNQ